VINVFSVINTQCYGIKLGKKRLKTTSFIALGNYRTSALVSLA